MAGIGSYKKGKKFELRSGNKPSSFKLMGSVPLSPGIISAMANRDDTDSPFSYRKRGREAFRAQNPKISKFVDKYVNPVIEKAGEHFANVATAGGYKAAKKYIRKKGGLVKTFDKYFTEPTPEQKKKNTEKIENFVSTLSTLKDKLPTGGFGRKKKNKK
jgi:hypothetical protein